MSLAAKTAYISVDEAQTYFNGRLNTEDWDDAAGSDKRKSLIEATTILDQINYIGDKYVNTQEHEFPRLVVVPTIDPIQYDTDNVPMLIKYATAEMALALLAGFDRDAEIKKNTTRENSYGSAKATYDREVLPLYARAGIPPQVWMLIQPLVRDPNTLLLSRV